MNEQTSLVLKWEKIMGTLLPLLYPLPPIFFSLARQQNFFCNIYTLLKVSFAKFSCPIVSFTCPEPFNGGVCQASSFSGSICNTKLG